MPAPCFQVIARYHPLEGRTDAVLELLGELAAASRAEPANQAYEFYRGVERPDEIVILERYDDEAGFAAHRESEHFQRIGVGRIIPMLADRVIERYVAAPGA
ncbi:antibiotic biosynthesis monooxygenase [Agromyces sp. SYSU K20354]|uniref:putative quinol monooxygenase n=1 Tax=Agromyces cavernae TaxID=2898659 RepID=UPI001E504962|nr:antibiotic biosynthesis monooxygenase family protein [Agromyces cavernae]MCD2440719.1 antibiotic biosynthesis monooxygenase [Agromyces cavernae]